MNSLKEALRKTKNSFKNSIFILLGVILLIGLGLAIMPKEFAIKTGNILFDGLIGTTIGSIAAGNPITSYIIGGELLSLGTGLFTVTAFLVAWVTVGAIQIPAETYFLGKKFTIARNIVSFVFSIITALLVTLTIGLI